MKASNSEEEKPEREPIVPNTPEGRSSGHQRPPLSPTTRVAVYTMIAAGLSAIGFVALQMGLPDLGREVVEGAKDAGLNLALVMTTGVMFFAGALGGCLYNLRGLTKHSDAADYDEKHNLSYYVRPVSSGISGLIVFFLLLGGAMTLNVDRPVTSMAWTTLLGRMPYVAFSLLAGYGSHEFMAKLKDLADSLFALRQEGQVPPTGPTEPAQ